MSDRPTVNESDAAAEDADDASVDDDASSLSASSATVAGQQSPITQRMYVT